MSLQSLARWHGAFNVAAGLWPLASIRSSDAVFGPKEDRWLEYTVAGLLITSGATLATDRQESACLAIGTAGTLLSIDLLYVPRGRISRIYLADAAFETAWIAAWLVALIRARRERSERST